MNIADLSGQNSDNLKRSYNFLEERYRDRNTLDTLRRFVGLVKDKWAVSINMRQGALNSFMIAGRYTNVYESKRERGEELKKVRKLGISVERAIEKHLKDDYKSRVTFDRSFEDGENFKYGALNIGGLGPKKRFGQYCVVIERKHSEEYSSLAFIKADSLNYVDEHRVNIDRLSQDIANKECVHLLVALKHENDIEGTPADEWPSMTCCDKSYTEAITTDDILSAHIESVRMSRKDHVLYYDYLYKDFISELSATEKRYRLEDFRNMQELLARQGTTLEVIDDNGD